ncbi:MAG: TIGR00645 family protein [Alphaproteobacteria bacterium]|nr:TIGR00645 family protein [Alphaproteobacteria bacterium]MBF0251516.1 TIGR00645 family protein [Alphaproteobacteria bacterium]
MIERYLERLIFASRWIMAPFYLGLVVSLAMLLVKFMQELLHVAPMVFTMSETAVILTILSLIDLSLAGNLLLMVIFAGYENFVSKIDTGDHEDRPDWMGKVDFSGLKLKLIASIVAISGIQLLRAFMNVQETTKEDLMWMLIIHMTFVTSGVLLALMDKLVDSAHHGSDR